MENALYYTLSTVSQTLAGALGMLAAFLVLRTMALDTTFHRRLEELESRAGGGDVGTRPVSGSAEEILAGWRDRFKGDRQGLGYGEVLLMGAETAHAARRVLLSDARRAFLLSVSVMVGCFVGLAFAPIVGQTEGVAVCVLAAAILGGLACMRQYVSLVLRSLQ